VVSTAPLERAAEAYDAKDHRKAMPAAPSR
jgi:hypothetical protein